MRTPHTSTRKGKMIRIVLRTGDIIYDKFVERTGKFIILENHKIRPVDIKSFTIYKPTR